MKTLQEHYTAIKNGQGNKAQFLKQARSLFPEYFNQYTDFDTATNVLKSKQIISEAAGGVVAKGFSVYDWKKILGEEVKAMEKETSKEVLDNQKNAFQPSDMKNVDNINFNEIMKGFFAEMYDAQNKEKTGDEIKAMVVKNLAKDPLYYTKNGNFSTMGVGYTDEAPGLGKNTQPTSKNASILGARSEVNSESDIVKNSLVGSAKKNVQDSLGNSEAKTSMPKKVKEMPDKGVQGVEKKIKLKENKETDDEKIKRYENYTYFLNGKKVKPDEIAFYDHILKAEIDGKIYKIGIPKDGKVELKEEIKWKRQSLNENYEMLDQYVSIIKSNNMDKDVAYVYLDDQGLTSSQIWSILDQVFPKTDVEEVRANTNRFGQHKGGSGEGGRRFIPYMSVLSRDAVDAINAKGVKRANWNKPHIKVLKSGGDEVKLLISQLLLDAITGAQRGRVVYKPGASIKGTGITSDETKELSPEFKKLVKVLSMGGKLAKTGDYYLLDIPIKYNEARNQYEMPLPQDVAENLAEQKLRSLIQQIIKEELNENLYTNEKWSLTPEGAYWVVAYRTEDGTKEKSFKSEDEAREWIKQNLDK